MFQTIMSSVASEESAGGCQDERLVINFCIFLFPLFLIASQYPLFLPPFTFFFHLNRFTARDDFGGDWIGESLGGRGGGDVKIHGEQVG